jgi:hypothetical protein
VGCQLHAPHSRSESRGVSEDPASAAARSHHSGAASATCAATRSRRGKGERSGSAVGSLLLLVAMWCALLWLQGIRVDYNAKDYRGCTPLHYAAGEATPPFNPPSPLVRHSLAHSSRHRFTPPAILTHTHSGSVTRSLVHSLTRSLSLSSGCRCLCDAPASSDIHAVKWLMEKGALPSTQDLEGYLPESYAEQAGDAGVAVCIARRPVSIIDALVAVVSWPLCPVQALWSVRLHCRTDDESLRVHHSRYCALHPICASHPPCPLSVRAPHTRVSLGTPFFLHATRAPGDD